MNGLDFLKKIKSKSSFCEVILITAYGTIHDGVYAMKQGAFDYITKGDGDEQIVVSVEKAAAKAKINRQIHVLGSKTKIPYSFDRIIGKSKILKKTIELSQKVAPTNSTVLIEGETGTGKELFAQSIHNASPRKNNSFVAVNCSAFPKELLESEIFGHKKGAFTGAHSEKKGLFEEANEGTLFLDEIAELDRGLQSKFLRVLEDQAFTKIGDTKPTLVNVRIIAATNRDLLNEVQHGKFRKDLYYRLSVFKIQVASLRDRKEDIPVLVNNFVEYFSIRIDKKIQRISTNFLDHIEAYSWPGNIRELKNVIERAVILSDDGILSSEHLPVEVLFPSGVNLENRDYRLGTIEEMEKIHIRKMLDFTHGNKTKAAEKLGIGIPTLYRKIENYGINL